MNKFATLAVVLAFTFGAIACGDKTSKTDSESKTSKTSKTSGDAESVKTSKTSE